MPRVILPCLIAAALSSLAGAAQAATAHNSQAGAYGPNTHQCEATVYFAAGGCASAAFDNERRYPFDVPPSPDRPGRRLTYPGTPVDAPGY